MGNGMNKIITGVYVGNIRDSENRDLLSQNNITHILSIHDNAKNKLKDKEYLCIVASDTPSQHLKQYFQQCNDFIHQARLNKGNVLIHCLAGVSRSVTITAAYIMSVTSLSWREALNAIRGARSCANPNFGFQKQLQEFNSEGLEAERKRLQEKFGQSPFEDENECKANLEAFQNFVLHGDSKEKDDGLYSLPSRAYGERGRNRTKEDSDSEVKVQSNNESESETATKHNRNDDIDIENSGDDNEDGST